MARKKTLTDEQIRLNKCARSRKWAAANRDKVNDATRRRYLEKTATEEGRAAHNALCLEMYHTKTKQDPDKVVQRRIRAHDWYHNNKEYVSEQARIRYLEKKAATQDQK